MFAHAAHALPLDVRLEAGVKPMELPRLPSAVLTAHDTQQ